MENLTSYRVNVITAGHTIVHRNRQVRTPVVFKEVYKHEIPLLESQMKSKSLDYKIDENKEEEIVPDEVTVEVKDDVKIEELYPEEEDEGKPESIMDKLISENG